MLESGEYGCCGYPNATCCPDHKTCCRNGYTCNMQTGQCDPKPSSIPASHINPSIAQKHDLVGDIVCPGSQETCPDGSTCCVLTTGKIGCCPYPDAVCCAGHDTCCKHGYTCDSTGTMCNPGNGGNSVPAVQKLLASVAVKDNLFGDILCPGGHVICHAGSTCCLLTTGKFGCCPYPDAVCCDGHDTCCKHGYTCDSTGTMCNPGNGGDSIPAVQKLPASSVLSITTTSVVCPDHHECPDGTTCCDMGGGTYGCCPVPNAVCCSDHVHCCPEGYNCDVAGGTCSMQNVISIPWLEKVPAKPAPAGSDQSEPVEGGSVVCPDQTSTCPDGSTCCKLKSGEYGCCPVQKAVCCSDHMHCCPEGSTCDVAEGRCMSTTNSLSTSWYSTRRTLSFVGQGQNKVTVEAKANVCDDKTLCPKGTTCCVQTSGDYACCPHFNATCCPDKVHCCPQGSTCDTKEGKCNPQATTVRTSWLSITRNLAMQEVLPMVAKQPAQEVTSSAGRRNMVVCPDRVHQCPQPGTCCKLVSGAWGCCPFPQAVCCSDHTHCCPQNFRCEMEQSRCVQNGGTMEISATFIGRTKAIMP